MMDLYNQAIPKVEFPTIKEFQIDENNEEIIDLRGLSDRILISPEYYKQGIPGAPRSCYLRKTPALLLVQAAEKLPEGLCLKVFDGWRPYVVQMRLWNYYYTDVKMKNPNLSEAELELKTSFFVSRPTEDINQPFLHNTGGAVDLTICDSNGVNLDMGTEFDDFTSKAWTNYFEEAGDGSEKDIQIRNNRRLLYNLMLSVGFTNLPSEWWHYDYGTKFWGYFKKVNPIYKGQLALEGIRVFPII